MEQSHEQIAAAGLRIIAVGLGEPKHARQFCGKLAPHLTCHVDSDKTAYKTYGLKQGGLSELISPSVLLASARAASRGHVQGEATGDTKMLPGTFIVDGEGVIRFAHYSSHAGDHPDIARLLRTARVMAEQARSDSDSEEL